MTLGIFVKRSIDILDVQRSFPGRQEQRGSEVVLPLQGIRVVALEHAVAGPLCTRHLADLGAEVIKIERPGEGDFARGYDSFVLGLSGYFVWLNRGKKSVSMDIKHPGAGPVLERLVAGADVVVQNLAPGAARRAGLSYETLRRNNPRIVVVDISGYGESGPFAQKKAYDMLIQAESGVISVTGSEEQPSRVGVSLVDMATGLYAHSGAVAALLRRERMGEGSNVKVAMLDAMAEWMTYPLYRYGYGGSLVERLPLTHPVITPYGAFATKDGQVVFSIQNEREWASFCREVLKRPEICQDPRFSNNSARRDNAAALQAIIEAAFSDKTATETAQLLDSAGIANGRLNDGRGLWEHQQLRERNRWREVNTANGPIKALLPPFTFSEFDAVMGDVPMLGEHTRTVLTELGFHPEEIDDLKIAGAI